MDDLMVITYANKDNWGLANLEKTLKRLDYNYRVIGKGEKWEGFHTKMRAILRFCKEEEKERPVCIIDAFDVLAFRPPRDLLECFKRLSVEFKGGDPVIVGAESLNFGFPNSDRYYHYWGLSKGSFKYKYFNGGCVMGRIKDIEKMYKWILRNGYTDDQVGIINYANNHPELVKLDNNQELVYNVSMFSKYDIKDRQLYPLDTNTKPIFAHCPGNVWDFGMRMDYVANGIIGDEYITNTWLDRIKEFFLTLYKYTKSYLLYVAIIIAVLVILLVGFIGRRG